MAFGRPLQPLILSDEVREQLESFERSRSLPAGLVLRAEIVLLCAQDLDNGTVAEMTGVVRQTVGKWRERFRKQGLMGLYDEARPGRLLLTLPLARQAVRTDRTFVRLGQPIPPDSADSEVKA
jgi:hypothetical protein